MPLEVGQPGEDRMEENAGPLNLQEPPNPTSTPSAESPGFLMREPPEPQHPRQNLRLFGVQETNRSLIRGPRGRPRTDNAHRDRVELRDSLVDRDVRIA